MANINNTTNDTLISGSYYADAIVNRGENVTIDGGLGNDVISLSGSKQVVKYSGSNDTIYGLGDDDIIRLTNTFSNYPIWANVKFSGSDIVLRAYDDTSLTLKNAVGKKFKMIDDDGTNLFMSTDGVTISNESDYAFYFAPYLENAVTKNIVIKSGDHIELSGIDNVTVMSIGGDDLISLGGLKNFIVYEYGNDTIYGLGDNDTVKPHE